MPSARDRRRIASSPGFAADTPRIATRARTTAAIARRAIGQRRIPFSSDDERKRLRDSRVRAMARYAAETVPHYRDLLRREGIDWRELQTAEDLDRLPVLDRAQLQDEPDRFVSTSSLGSTALRFPTNGTTGTPLVVCHDRPSVLANIAYGERERVVEASLTGKRVRYVVVDINYGPRDTGFQVLRFYRRATALPLRPQRHMLRMAEPFDHIVAALNGLRPDVLQGYGSYLETLFERLAETGVAVHLPRLVLYGSDTMTLAGRRFIEDRFGIPVISRYNAVEAFKIGFTCEQRAGIHVEDDLCHVRVLSGDGGPAPAGAHGEVVISNLVNRGTVLLNYRLGDLATWSAEPCRCGRRTPVLSDVEGRLEATVRLPDGRFVPEGAVQVLLKDRGLATFQLVQLDSTHFELRLLAAARTDEERILPTALPELEELLGGAVVSPTFQEALAPAARGIFRYVVPLTASGADTSA